MALLGSGLIAGQGIAAPMAGRLAENSGYGAAFAPSCAFGLAAVLVALTLVRQKAFAAPAQPLPTAWAGTSAARWVQRAQGRTGGVHPKICRPVP